MDLHHLLHPTPTCSIKNIKILFSHSDETCEGENVKEMECMLVAVMYAAASTHAHMCIPLFDWSDCKQ